MKLTQLISPWWVECDVCQQIYKDHAGSTPCCGSVASLIVDEKQIKVLKNEIPAAPQQ